VRRLLLAAARVAAGAAPALADPAAAVRSAMIAFAKLTSYHINVQAQGRTIDVDMVMPARTHIVTPGAEVIAIDGTTWVKAGGSWRQITFPFMGQLTGMYQSALDALRNPSGDFVVTDLGTKNVDGETLHAYLVKSNGGDGSTVYLDAKGALARVDTTSGFVRFSKFNAPIAIDPPT